MTRILFWLALVFLVVHAIRSKLSDAQQPRERRQSPPPRDARQAGQAGQARQAGGTALAIAEAETMLCCAHCAIYYPASENVRSDGRDYCSAAHVGLPAA